MQCLDYTELYRTAPLQHPKTQIRLLRATQLEEQYLSYEFVVCNLTGAPPYDAISYTWGDSNERGFIRVNNVPIGVTENCRYALWQVRNLGSICTWIDAVCIDQRDLEEKGTQVALMWDIYKSASQVLACIGPPDEVSDRVCAAITEFDAVEESDEVKEERKIEGYFSPRTFWLVQKGDAFCKALWQDCEQFSTRPYFSRLWIAQELCAGGPRACIVFGAAKLGWELVTALYHTFSEPEDLDYKIFTQIHHLDAAIADRNSEFGAHLQWTQNLLSCDVRDHIYGTLHLFDWESTGIAPLEPDYTRSPFEVAVKIASLMSDINGTSAYGLAIVVDSLEIKAFDPCLQPYLSRRGTRRVQSQRECRQWEVYMYSEVQLDKVAKCREKGTRCTLTSEGSPECETLPGLERTDGQSRSDKVLLAKKHICSSACQATAGGLDVNTRARKRFVVSPLTVARRHDLVLTFGWDNVKSSLILRKSVDQDTMIVIGRAGLVEDGVGKPQDAADSYSSWQHAAVTMEATIEEMIGFLVPYDSHSEFHVPKIVSLKFYWNGGVKSTRECTVVDLSS